MRVIKFFVGGVLFTFAILAILAWVVLPSEFEITEQVEIQQSPEKVFAAINDLETWEAWVFDKQEGARPAVNYTTIRSGEGARAIWEYPDGNRVEISIIQTVPVEKISLVFKKPTEDDFTTIEVTLQPNNGGTLLTWKHTGEYGWGIAARISASMLDFEGKTAEIYKAQLARLRTYCERAKSGS